MDIDVSEVMALAGELAAAGPKVKAKAQTKVAKVAKDTARNAQATAPVRTGRLRSSINAQGEGDEWVVSADADYAVFVEFGTYKDAPQPFLLPQASKAEAALEDELSDIGDPFA